MKRWLLTLPLLLAGMTGLVHGDYYFILINTGEPANPVVGGNPAFPSGMQKAAAPTIKRSDFVGVLVESENLVGPAFTFSRQGLLVPIHFHQYSLRLPSSTQINQIIPFALEQRGGDPNKWKLLPNVHRRFKEMSDRKLPPAQLADFALTHGLVDKFISEMDKLVEEEGGASNPAVAMYRKVHGHVQQPLSANPESPWLTRLKNAGFKTVTSDHYFVMHNADGKYKADVESRLARLEDAYKTFYYWHAMNGIELPMPARRLPVIMAQNEDDDILRDFRRFADGEVDRLRSRREDGFLAVREGILYLSLISRQPNVEKLSEFLRKRAEAAGGSMDAHFKLIAQRDAATVAAGDPLAATALAVKVLEADAERWTVSHFATLQLVYAAEMLPNNVVAPEWLLNGMAGFFETPLGSPWACPTSPDSPHLKLCDEVLKDSTSSAALLKGVVSDAVFHEAKSAADNERASILAQARALSWGLTYYLSRNRQLPILRAYFAELRKMPRDLPFDGESKYACFVRALEASKVDVNKFAADWKKELHELTSQNKSNKVIEKMEADMKSYQDSFMRK